MFKLQISMSPSTTNITCTTIRWQWHYWEILLFTIFTIILIIGEAWLKISVGGRGTSKFWWGTNKTLKFSMEK